MTSTRLGWFAAGLGSGIAGTVFAVHTVVPLFAAPANTSRIVLENARVRVKEAVFMPNTPNPGMHTHDLPHVGVVIDGGKMIFRSPDGTTETMTLERGGVGYRDANVTHEPVNLGTTPVRVIEVELK
jgi:mannose-6-phosphate isomerase-like protein (cupin superfamily)